MQIIIPVLGTYPNPRTGVAVPPDEMELAVGMTGQRRRVAIPPRRQQLDAGHLRRYQQGLGGRMTDSTMYCTLAEALTATIAEVDEKRRMLRRRSD